MPIMRVGGLGGLTLVAWGLLAAREGMVAEGIAITILLGLALGSAVASLRLVAPLSLFTFLFLSLLYGVKESLVVVGRFTLIALSASVGLRAAGPRGLASFLSGLGAPPAVAGGVLMVYRLADFLSGVVWEARDALAGRGAGGRWGALLRLPLPLVIHSFRASMSVAEALFFKRPEKRVVSSLGKPVYWGDVVVLVVLLVSYLVLKLVLTALPL